MLPEIGASELLVIAVVALIVVGPKDLPMLLRRLGQFMAKLRGMAAEFRASFEEMGRETELEELRREVEAIRRGQLSDFRDPELDKTFAELNQSLTDVGVDLDSPGVSPQPVSEEMIETPKPVRKRSTSAAKPRAKAAAAKTPATRKPRAKKPAESAKP